MTNPYGSQNEKTEEKKRRQANEELSKRTPHGAFTDDPSADKYDKHGRVFTGSQNLPAKGGLDLGQFPPNE